MMMTSRKKTIPKFKYLPLEIQTLILARLPAKTLIRFRCVCKSWCSIIDSPNFVHLHLQLSNFNHSCKNKLFVAFENLGVEGIDGPCSLSIHKADTFEKTADIFTSSEMYYPLASCNGLILIRKYVGSAVKLRLWNPSIRKSLLIPSRPIPSNLVFSIAYVFGFAPSTNDYKILAITLDRNTDTQPIDMFFAVYTLSNQQWTVRNYGFDIERSCYKRIFWAYYFPSQAVYFQGAVHTGCAGKGIDIHGDNKEQLVSLDLDLEEFTCSELPIIFDKNYHHHRSPFILGNSLAIFSISYESASIWMSELDNGKRVWSLWFSGLARPDVMGLFGPPLFTKVLYYESDDGGCFISGNRSYNIASRQMQNRGESMMNNVQLETYLESLVLHKAYGAQDDVSCLP